jgi:hypothetical protein
MATVYALFAVLLVIIRDRARASVFQPALARSRRSNLRASSFHTNFEISDSVSRRDGWETASVRRKKTQPQGNPKFTAP